MFSAISPILWTAFIAFVLLALGLGSALIIYRAAEPAVYDPLEAMEYLSR